MPRLIIRAPSLAAPLAVIRTAAEPEETLTLEGTLGRVLWLDGTRDVVARGAAQLVAAGDPVLAAANVATLRPGAGTFAAGCWVRFDSLPESGFAVALGHYQTADNRRSWRLDYAAAGGGQLRFVGSVDGTALAIAAVTLAPTLGQWYFLFGWYDAGAGVVGCRVDDGAPVTAASAGLYQNADDALTVGAGAAAAPTQAIDGRIAEPFLLKAPTASVATVQAALYNGGQGVGYGDLSSGQKADFGLVSWWPLREASGTRFDAHGDHDLTPTGGPTAADGPVASAAAADDPAYAWDSQVAAATFTAATVADRPAWRAAGYLDFDGAGAGDRLSRAGAVVGNRSAFTLFLKARLDQAPASNPAVLYCEEDAAGAVRFRVAVTSNSQWLQATYKPADGSSATASSNDTFPVGADVVLAVRRDGTSLRLFVAGAPIGAAATIAAGVDLSGATSRVGGPVAATGVTPLDGRVHHVWAVDRALTDGEIATLSALF